MASRGYSKRHTLAMDTPEDSNSGSSSSPTARTRRTGLLTVMERPPVISPELVNEVETRMNRAHQLPPKFASSTAKYSAATTQYGAATSRPKCYTRMRKTSQLATVDEARRVSHVGGRDTLKESSWTQERYSPVRRCSEGSATLLRAEERQDVKHLQQEYQILHRTVTGAESPCRSPIEGHSPSPQSHSPTPVSVHSITQGLSSLTTSNAGSITQGTPTTPGAYHAGAAPPSQLPYMPIPIATLAAAPLPLDLRTNLTIIREELCAARPQISLTDELGGEVTLVPPSAPHRRDAYATARNLPLRRTFPTDAPAEDLLTSQLVEKTSSGSFELRLSECYSALSQSDLLSIVKRIIEAKAPPTMCLPTADQLALEYPGGVQIQLVVQGSGLKLRRISGDHLQYSQLCQQLISCIIV